MLFLYSTQGSDKICQDLQRSAKICQDQTRSTKGSASTNLQAPLAETNHETPSSKNEGAAVSRRMASSIRSGPVGARGVFNSKLAFPIYYISIILVFFLGYILSGGFFDVKLGGCGVTPPPPFSHQFYQFSRSIFGGHFSGFWLHFWITFLMSFHILALFFRACFLYRFFIEFRMDFGLIFDVFLIPLPFAHATF